MSAPDRNRIERYVVIDVPWRGGRGVVYRAWDRQLNRQLAIKTLTDGFTDDEEMLKRFYQETTKTGALRHPNIRHRIRSSRTGRFFPASCTCQRILPSGKALRALKVYADTADTLRFPESA